MSTSTLTWEYKAQRAVSKQIGRNLTFQAAVIVHQAGWLWEWRGDENVNLRAEPEKPAEPAEAKHPTGVIHDDRMELRRLRARVAELTDEGQVTQALLDKARARGGCS